MRDRPANYGLTPAVQRAMPKLGLMLMLLLVALPARADFLYTFERTATNPYSFSFMVRDLIIGVQDPLPVTPLPVESFVFTDAAAVVSPDFSCFVYVTSGSSAFADSDSCGISGLGMFAYSFSDLGAPGVYSLFSSTGLPIGGVQSLAISSTTPAVVPEPSSVILLGTACGLMSIRFRKRLIRSDVN